MLVAVWALVIVSGLVIAFLVTQRYSSVLRKAMVGQAENMAHAVALDAADKILINDLVGLQRMLDQQIQSNPSVGYILVFREGRVLAHTFEQGVPANCWGLMNRCPGNGPSFGKSSPTGENTTWIPPGPSSKERPGCCAWVFRRVITGGKWLDYGWR